MNIYFSRIGLSNLKQEDLMTAVSDIVAQYGHKFRIWLLDHYYENDSSSDKMETVVVRFQVWDEHEGGTGTQYFWYSYQGKDNSCSNRNIRAFQPMPRGSRKVG